MDKKILIAYYSWSGNTEYIAKQIQKSTGGSFFIIKPVNEYPDSYRPCVDQAKKEINAGITPELKALPDDLDSYDIVFVGSPVWWHTTALPVSSFLTKVNLSGKTVVPFCTHGGGGKGHLPEDIKKYCPGSEVLDELVLSGNGGRNADSEISAWLNRIGITGIK